MREAGDDWILLGAETEWKADPASEVWNIPPLGALGNISTIFRSREEDCEGGGEM